MSTTFRQVFKVAQPIIGMIHLKALTATPAYQNNNQEIIQAAIAEAMIYKNAGIDAIAIENMHDVPYVKNGVGHEISSLMAIIAYEIKKQTQLPIGVQILAAANKEALAVAKSAGLDFIRAEGFVYGHIADEGYIDSNAGELLRYRKMIDAENILIFTDIKKKHSAHQITADVDLIETAKTAAYFRSDALIITGASTGEQASLEDIQAVKQHCKIPILVGSGVTIDNVEQYLSASDALIVGSWFKKDGYWTSDLDPDRIRSFMTKVNQLR